MKNFASVAGMLHRSHHLRRAQMSKTHENNATNRLCSKSNVSERDLEYATPGKRWNTSWFVEGKKLLSRCRQEHPVGQCGPWESRPPRLHPSDERIFHAPCISPPDVSNPRRIGHAPNFPRHWEARERKTFECNTRVASLQQETKSSKCNNLLVQPILLQQQNLRQNKVR